jgi:hypothetical protein
MNIIKLKKYGSALTGRNFGKEVMDALSKEIQYPVALDFEGVTTLGSSFGEEIIVPICKKQKGTIDVYNANPAAVVNCLKTIENDFNIKINLIRI